MADTVKSTITDGRAVFIDGEQHSGGQPVDVSTDLVEYGQQAGWATAVEDKRGLGLIDKQGDGRRAV
jgi:hypothetical protein